MSAGATGFAFAFARARPRRRLSLTPMIDVVFLLLVFFMLAARFGPEAALAMASGGPEPGAARWEGPPRLVEIGPDTLRLNGVETEPARLAAALRPLMPAPDAPVVLRPVGEARLQALVDVGARLRAAGIGTLVVVE
jgi:biopolymer transport protein ExbD